MWWENQIRYERYVQMEVLIIGTVVVMLIGLSLQRPPAPQQPPPPVVYIPVQAPPQPGNEAGSGGGGLLWLGFLLVMAVLALLYGVPAI
jgi:hypothetical protein